MIGTFASRLEPLLTERFRQAHQPQAGSEALLWVWSGLEDGFDDIASECACFLSPTDQAFWTPLAVPLVCFGHVVSHRRVPPFAAGNKQCSSDHKRFYKGHARFFKRLRKHIETEMRGAKFLSDDIEPAGITTRDTGDMQLVCEWIEAHRGEWPELGYQRNDIWLRFNHEGYNKGTALLEVRRVTGIGAEFTFAAGDNYNDLPMLQTHIAHGLACPSNAVPDIATHVTELGGFVAPEPATSGIIMAIEHYFYPDGV